MNAVDLEKQPEAVDDRVLPDSEESEIHYRAISKAAIVSLVFGILGLTSFLASVFVLLPLLGFFFGLLALINIKRYPQELMGRIPAMVGTLLSLICLTGSIGMHSYIYATEVPEGYQRMSFWDLKPVRNSQTPFSDKSKELDGQKVFLKGYVRPGVRQKKLKKFILVGDFSSCCFGGNPEITDVVSVTIENPEQTVDYSLRLRRITGTFKLNPRRKALKNEKDIPAILYEIYADNVK